MQDGRKILDMITVAAADAAFLTRLSVVAVSRVACLIAAVILDQLSRPVESLMEILILFSMLALTIL